MKKSIIALLLFWGIVAFANAKETYFKFSVNSISELKKLTKIISIDNVKEKTVYAYANEREFKIFSELGYSYQILPNPSTLTKAKMANSPQQMRNWDFYPTYETYVSMMYQFEEDYPDLCEIENIGTTVNGRELLFAKISDNVHSNEDEPEFMYTATMHGDELVGYVLMLRLIDYLLSNYETNSQVANLVNNLEIWINPLANPDGTFAAGNNTVNGATRYNGNNIDLNRNFPDPEEGDHPDGNEWQPETIAMINFANSHHFVLSANLHSGAEVVNYPWDTWERLHADNDWWQTVSRQYAETAQENSPFGYMTDLDDGITNGFEWYTISGGRQDFMNYFAHCRELTLELSHTKMLAAEELPDYWNYNKDSFLLYMTNALYGVRGIVTDVAGIPLDAVITVVNHDIDNSEVITDPEIGDYHRFLYTGNYDFRFETFGYIPQSVENVNVTENNITIINVQLSQAETFLISGIISDAENFDPIENAFVQLLNTPLSGTYTDENGYFEMEDVPEGNYSVQVSANNYGTLITEISVNENTNSFSFHLEEINIISFESGNFDANWNFSGNADWTVDGNISYEGNYSARSGNISDNQTSTAFLEITVSNSSQIGFFRKVSSEAGYDFLKFFIDDTEMDEWSGYSDWEEEIYSLTAGFHVLKWTYQKDDSVSEGEDCGWIDYISLPSFTAVGDYLLDEDFADFDLKQNFPNPFTASTVISFSVSNEQNKQNTISIYNVKGQKIRQFSIPNFQFSIVWDGTDNFGKKVSPGIYFYEMNFDNSKLIKKMLKIE